MAPISCKTFLFFSTADKVIISARRSSSCFLSLSSSRNLRLQASLQQGFLGMSDQASEKDLMPDNMPQTNLTSQSTVSHSPGRAACTSCLPTSGWTKKTMTASFGAAYSEASQKQSLVRLLLLLLRQRRPVACRRQVEVVTLAVQKGQQQSRALEHHHQVGEVLPLQLRTRAC